MLTMIGLARSQPTSIPCAAVAAPAKARVSSTAGTRPVGRRTMKAMAEAEAVAPRLKEMTLPLSVTKLIPTATQPTTDVVLAMAIRFGRDRNPGVATARPRSTAKPRPQASQPTARGGSVGRRAAPSRPRISATPLMRRAARGRSR